MWNKRTTTLGLLSCLAVLPLGAQTENIGCVGDLDGNFAVDLDDLMTMLTLYGSTCVPDTASDWPCDPEEETGSLGRVWITEIMYNPSSAQGSDTEYEFLELYNPDSSAVDMSGWRLDNAVSKTFPDGTVLPGYGFVAVVRDSAAMAPLVPDTALMIQWNSSSSLNNTGETIELYRADDTLSDEVPYEDNDGWVGQPDGGGPSLEWFDVGLNNDYPDAWTFSLIDGGTPGAPNSMWGLSDPE